MFHRPPDDDRDTVTVHFEGQAIAVPTGETVAAALVIANAGATRTTPVSGAPRAPYCLMGACFECLVEIDGVADRQACLIEAKDGMRVARQRGAAAVSERTGEGSPDA